ncbi:hypothetical protein [Sphingosinicella terrae]|uniref:hypothetical protein n=1 Tax=Sphingosinicella terrae TaxID=2172047 RepID=UPI000E0D3CB5|nr:hypothetical protein [Sphingosinicella terrae]
MNAATLSGGPADRSMTWSLRAARLMGWASFGLAVAFVAAPGRIARTFGLEGKENLIRSFGAQEAMAGISVLSTEVTPAMWSRAAGDVIHIGTLATGLRTDDSRQHRNVVVGLAALAGFLLVDSLIAAKLGSERTRSRGEARDYSGRSGFPKGRPSAASASAAERQQARQPAMAAG